MTSQRSISSTGLDQTGLDETGLTPAEMSDRSGVSIDTLRYYEREGLITNVARAESGHRRYSEDDVLWVEVLRCLRDTGMTIEQLRHYCELGAQGDHTAPDRQAILVEHRTLVTQQIAERQEALRLIDHKLSFYESPNEQVADDQSVNNRPPDKNERE